MTPEEQAREAKSDYMREWRAKNRERVREYRRKYYRENREKLQEYHREYNKGHREEIKRAQLGHWAKKYNELKGRK